MPTLAEIEPLLSRYSGNLNTFLTRLNLVRARLIQSGNWSGLKRQIVLPVYSDEEGSSIVTPPREYKTILAGALTTDDVLCAGSPLGVRNWTSEFSKNGSGYGGLGADFQEVTGRFAVYQEWTTEMLLRFKFERTESAGTIHIRGQLDGEKVYSLYSATWIEGEKVDYVGTTTVTSTKLFDPRGLSIVKPATLGRVSMYTVDTDGIETLVAVYAPTEKFPQWRRYKVPYCSDAAAVSSTTTTTTTLPASQYYTRSEIDAMFSHEGTITVSAAGTTDLVYETYFLRTVRIVAEAGAASYIHKFTLDTAAVKDGAILRVPISVAASANPSLEFYNNTIAGTLLLEINGDSSNTYSSTAVFVFRSASTAWEWLGMENQ